MQAPTTPTQTLLQDILHQILIITTRALRDIHIRTSTAQILKTILAANLAGARIGRAIRLTALLIRRIQTHGLEPLTPARHPKAGPGTRTAKPPAAQPGTPRIHTGNADAAFIRRPLPIIVAAITRELHIAARILGVPLPENLQHLCLHAALATGALPPALPAPKPEPRPNTPQYPHPGGTPAPWHAVDVACPKSGTGEGRSGAGLGSENPPRRHEGTKKASASSTPAVNTGRY